MKPKTWGDGTAGQPMGPPTRADLRARGVENLLAAGSAPTTRSNIHEPAPLTEESSEITLRRAALRVEQVALTIQQTIFDMQPPTSVRDEEDWESLPDSSISDSSSASGIAGEDMYDAINRAWPARFRAARETSISDSSTSNGSWATEESERDIWDTIVANYHTQLRAARERSMSESSASNNSSATEMNEGEIADAMVAALLPKLRGGRAIVRQEALAINRELGINPTTVSMTVAEAALATTNEQMGTAVTMEEVEAMRPIDLSFPEPEEEELAPGELEEDEQEEIIAAFIRKVKEENEK